MTPAYPRVCLLLVAVVSVPALGSDDTVATDPEYELLRAAQATFRSVASQMRPYLVRVETVGGSQPPDVILVDPDAEQSDDEPLSGPDLFRDSPGSDFVLADGPTTGIIYSEDGYIITSSFNFVREPLLISVTLADGRQMAADLIARDKVRKIALLKVDATGLAVPAWRNVDDIRVGEWAVALGLGFGGDESSVTVGIISALDRMHGNAVQTDAKLSPANYGGPLCDVSGRIVGISVPMAQRPGELAGVKMYDSGVGFAVPKHRVDQIVTELKKGRTFYRGWLGIQIDPLVIGAVGIRRVANPSPMHTAGVRPGDRIVWAEGRTLHHFGDLVQAIYMIPAGEQVYLSLERDTIEFGLAVNLARNTELGPLPEEPEPFDPSSPFPTRPGEPRP